MAHESARISQVHKYVPKEVLSWKINDQWHRGVPDAYYSGNKTDLWVEYKQIAQLPKRVPLIPKLSSLQYQWLREQKERGRNTWVIVFSDQKHIILKEPNFWLEGVDPNIINAYAFSNYRSIANEIISLVQTTE